MSRIARGVRRGWRPLAAALAAAVLAIAGLAISATPAWAHNVLKSSNPAEGKTVPFGELGVREPEKVRFFDQVPLIGWQPVQRPGHGTLLLAADRLVFGRSRCGPPG